MIDKKLIFINTSIFVILIFFSEIFLRIINPPLIQIRVRTNKLARILPNERSIKNNFDLEKFKFYPNSKSKILHQEYNYIANHDFRGWRAPCYQSDKNPDFFLVGDSFVYGIGVQDSNTLSCALSRKNINSYTIGIPGANPKQYPKIIEKNKDSIENLDLAKKFDFYSVIFMGNDFENLLSYSNLSINDLNDKEKYFLKKIKNYFGVTLHDINKLVVYYNFLNLGDSYLISGIKVAFNKLRGPDKSNKYVLHGTTYYLKGTPLRDEELKNSLNLYLNNMKKLLINHKGFILIPDGTEISQERLNRKSKLRNMPSKKIDVNYKFNTFISACQQLNLNCLDARKVLNSDTFYYVHDDHLNSQGVEKLAEFIKENIKL